MSDSLRALTRADFLETLRLGAEAFGHPVMATGAAPEIPATWPPEGQHSWATFRDGDMVARMSVREFTSWFDGATVPTAGVCGVTVAAEQRGQGLLTGLFEQMLADARSRGEVISTLYPTAPGIYRKFGYEIVGTLRQVEIPTAQLAGVHPAIGVRTRRATADDVPRIAEAYTAWAREQNGPLTRTGPLFDPADVLTDGTATSVAVDDRDRVVGYAVWSRGHGYGDDSALVVEDLVALDVEANRALWRMIGSFASVTGRVRLWTSGEDVCRLSLPTLGWRDVKTNPYMLRVLDVPGAFGLRQAPLGLVACLDFRITGDRTGLIDGAYQVSVRDGVVACVARGSGDDLRTYTPQGIALAWTGAQPSAEIRRAGHLTGPVEDDRTWDALTGGRTVHIRDYF